MFSSRPKDHESVLQNGPGKLYGDIWSTLVSTAMRAVKRYSLGLSHENGVQTIPENDSSNWDANLLNRKVHQNKVKYFHNVNIVY